MSFRRGPPNIGGMISLKVDNLTYRTTPDDLRRAFDKYGDVGDIYIPRDRFTGESRGFAFVRYYDKKDAEDALDEMDGAVMDGRELRVQKARYDRPDEWRGAPHSKRRGRGRRSRSRSHSRDKRYSRSRRHSKSGSRCSRSRSRRRSRSRSRSRRSSRRSRSFSKSSSRSKSRSRSQERNNQQPNSISRSRSRSGSASRSRSPEEYIAHNESDD